MEGCQTGVVIQQPNPKQIIERKKKERRARMKERKKKKKTENQKREVFFLPLFFQNERNPLFKRHRKRGRFKAPSQGPLR
ncbi:MAG: hypothetical protein Q8P67_02570 [archaeon]|nr:hypothetical protein [archaeon]